MLSSVLCGDPDGWDGGGQGCPSGRGGCVYTDDSLHLQQKLTQHCKATISQ